MTDPQPPRRQRILVFGATGQVGREVIPRLAPFGDVIAAARTPARAQAESDCLKLDLANLEAVRRMMRDVRPTIVVNAAAYTAVDKAESEEAQAVAINGEAPRVIAEEAARIGATVIHYSTDYVFDGSGTRPWREEDPPHPLNAYGRTKLAGDVALRDSGAAHVIFRVSWVYAAAGHNFVKTMLKLGAERRELKVIDDQRGAPTPAGAIAEATTAVVSRLAAEPKFALEHSGVYHLPCGGETSWHGFAIEIFRLAREAGVPLQIENVLPITTAEYPTPARRPLNSRLDGTRAEGTFGLRLPDWRTALAAEFPAILRAQAALQQAGSA